MKKILFVLFFIFLFSVVLAKDKIECSPVEGQEHAYTGNFTLNSYCEIPLTEKSKLIVEVLDGEYNNISDFHFPVSASLDNQDDFIPSALKGKVLLDCSDGFGDVLDIYADDFTTTTSYGQGQYSSVMDKETYKNGCGHSGDWITLNVGKPKLDLSSTPYIAKSLIKIEFQEKLIQTYLAGSFGFLVGNVLDNRKVDEEFSVIYPKESGTVFSSSKTLIQGNLKEIDYNPNGTQQAVFELINSDTKEVLCEITSNFDGKEAEFVSCKLAQIKITGLNSKGLPEETTKGLEYKFKYELKEINKEAVDLTKEETPFIDSGNGNNTTNPNNGTNGNLSDLTALQKQINESILTQYNKLMGVN